MSNTYILSSAMHFGYGYALSANSLPTTVLKAYTPLREKKSRAAQILCAARVFYNQSFIYSEVAAIRLSFSFGVS